MSTLDRSFPLQEPGFEVLSSRFARLLSSRSFSVLGVAQSLHSSLFVRPTDRSYLPDRNKSPEDQSLLLYSLSLQNSDPCFVFLKVTRVTLLFVDSFFCYTADINEACAHTKIIKNRGYLEHDSESSRERWCTDRLISFSLLQIFLVAIAIMALMKGDRKCLLEGACWMLVSLCHRDRLMLI